MKWSGAGKRAACRHLIEIGLPAVGYTSAGNVALTAQMAGNAERISTSGVP
jgi:hypothetical protein